MDDAYRPIRIVHLENENTALRKHLETAQVEVKEITKKIESNNTKIREEWTHAGRDTEATGSD